ncbi:MAG: CPBP family glutamic-type intramembrane protease [Acidobacteriota bacterium]|nr:CPBP family glutamic-type intramembrane protease [Acidobacteriota bacterium]
MFQFKPPARTRGSVIAAGVSWLMMTLAAAGCCYGYIYRKTGKLAPAALSHALVDTVWWAFFSA